IITSKRSRLFTLF
ncbi:hypothetical protein SCA6_018019, partial [Theobroma cacao]